MRLVFMGTPDFAVATLQALLKSDHQIVAVYSQPPRPSGRGKKNLPSPVQKLAEKSGIPVFTPLNFKAREDRDRFFQHQADAAIVAAYGLILPGTILAAPRLGCINVHASLLPRWRGAAPLHRAIEAGDTETGVCIMQMEKGLDTGPVFRCVKTPISSDMTTGDLHDILAISGGQALLDVLGELEAGKGQVRPQSSQGVTYARKVEKEDALINWDQSAAHVDCHIRSMTPWPGAFSHYAGDRVKILGGHPSVYPVDYSGDTLPGQLLNDTGLVACGDGAYQITRLQRPGREAQSIEVFLLGHALAAGTYLDLKSDR